jgi:uncharacterized membrane protein
MSESMSDPLFPVLLVLRYMHILGAIALMGATVFMRFALRPALGTLPAETRSALHEDVRRRWSKFVMLASALLFVSGVANLGLASRYEFKPVFGMPYHMVVGIKFLLALPIFFIAAFLTGRTPLAKRVQANAELWMTINLTLALIMVLIGGLLKFVLRVPKSDFMRPPSATAPADSHRAPLAQTIREPVFGRAKLRLSLPFAANGGSAGASPSLFVQ